MNACTNVFLELHARIASRRLESLIRARSYGQVRQLRLEWRDTGVILRGQASSYHLKQLAQQAVLEAGDLPLLANEIEVTRDEAPLPSRELE